MSITAQHQTARFPRGIFLVSRGRSRMAGRLERSRLQSAGADAASSFTRSLFVLARFVRALRRDAAMNERILQFLRNRREDGPCLVLDLDVVRENYAAFAKALPDTRVFYAVKANPDPRVLELLARLGSCFDAASVVEIEQVLDAGASADRISYGNTIKKERAIQRAYELGVRLFAVDCEAEVEKV